MSKADIERLKHRVIAELPPGEKKFKTAEAIVRAVLAALREPSEEIVDAGYARLENHPSDEWSGRDCSVRIAYIGMIDSILAD